MLVNDKQCQIQVHLRGQLVAHQSCDHQSAPASAILAFGAPVEKVRHPRTAWSTRGPRTMPSIVRLGREGQQAQPCGPICT